MIDYLYGGGKSECVGSKRLQNEFDTTSSLCLINAASQGTYVQGCITRDIHNGVEKLIKGLTSGAFIQGGIILELSQYYENNKAII